MRRKRTENSIQASARVCQNPAPWQCCGNGQTAEAGDFVADGIGHTRCSEGNQLGERMKMITILAVGLVMGWVTVAQAQVLVDPYLRRDGIYIDGHYRSNPDGNPYNNWSYPGNVNPYKQPTGDPNRYPEQYQKRNEQNQYQFNPYQFRW
jgi:hypothetical protein